MHAAAVNRGGRTAVNDKSAAAPAPRKFLYEVRENWLARRHEDAIEPGLPIIDPHHHLWDRFARYLLDELRADVGTGHNIRATVYLQCGSMYRADGDPKFAPLGETEFVNGVAAMSASDLYGPARLCAGIVGYADLTLGAAVEEVLAAHLRIAGERFKGVRHSVVWDADRSIRSTQIDNPPGLLGDAKFRAGFACLARHGLSFDSWNYHTQISELADLARAYPDTTIVLDHIGAPLAVGVYGGRRDEVFAHWQRSIREIAECPNACVKIGGMGMRIFGFGFDEQLQPPSSDDLAAAWRPYVETCIEAFGVKRAMFESNFPVDKVYSGYGVLWNAFKKLAAGCSADEKADLFFNTAKRVYRLPTTAA
jgi:predicted TIM-barrel fold metal-dependent hydrolase